MTSPPSIPPHPSPSMKNYTAIITGAGSSEPTGISNGRASAILLAEAGCNVLCVDLSLPWAESTVAMISSSNIPRAIAVAADVTKPEDCERIVKLALDEFGRVDILVNNVGIGGPPGTAVEVDVAAWARGLEVNVTSMMLMAKYAIPAMQLNEPRGDVRGSIVNMGSVAGLRGGTPSLLYPTSKGAIVNMTRAMAAHHARQGIRVNCVCPGMLYTPMMYAGGKMDEETRQKRKERSLLGTEGTAWDCAAVVRFLAGPEARWVTGSVQTVDAGASCATSTDVPNALSSGLKEGGEEEGV
ncbi:NAD(P)-binding protein [Aulographum hederae CBS 113979]|uniref:NAD(P)-binding protein n=1 Tax=Aulographum hederae CBS 113979 TaxID=1176131 RepID=A0A6G1HC60_9PEZI|nr:NAD(P)-binding protein [Aulographum hederae CBS 113979]